MVLVLGLDRFMNGARAIVNYDRQWGCDGGGAVGGRTGRGTAKVHAGLRIASITVNWERIFILILKCGRV
jgi:hypothetical protein